MITQLLELFAAYLVFNFDVLLLIQAILKLSCYLLEFGGEHLVLGAELANAMVKFGVVLLEMLVFELELSYEFLL